MPNLCSEDTEFPCLNPINNVGLICYLCCHLNATLIHNMIGSPY